MTTVALPCDVEMSAPPAARAPHPGRLHALLRSNTARWLGGLLVLLLPGGILVLAAGAWWMDRRRRHQAGTPPPE